MSDILDSICIDFLFKLTFYLTQENRTARAICAWNYTLQNSDDFLNSPSLQCSRCISVIRTKLNRGFGIRLDPSAIMILKEGSKPWQEDSCASQEEREDKTDFHLLCCVHQKRHNLAHYSFSFDLYKN